MELKDFNHIYKCKPKLWFNDTGEVTVNLKCAPKKDFDAHAIESQTYAVDERAKKGREFISRYVDSIEGLVVSGKEVKTFEQLYETGPADLYDWIYSAVLSQRILTEAEVKN